MTNKKDLEEIIRSILEINKLTSEIKGTEVTIDETKDYLESFYNPNNTYSYGRP